MSVPLISQVCTVREAARLLGVTPQWVRELVDRGELTQHELQGGARVIELSGVQARMKLREGDADDKGQ